MDTFPLQMVQEWVGGGAMHKGEGKGSMHVGGGGRKPGSYASGRGALEYACGGGEENLGSIRTRGEEGYLYSMHIEDD